MASGIEHRSPETVLQSYDAWERPNFAIYAGSMQKMYYDGGDMGEGRGKLEDILSAIDESQNQTVYTLKVYEDDAKKITKKTPEAGSTTFMLCNTARTRNENGVIVLDRSGNTPQGQNPMNAMMMQKMADLEKRYEDMRNDLHKEQIKSIQQEFTNKIAGLQRDADKDTEKSVLERIGELLIEKPERIDRLIDTAGDTIGKLVNYFTGGKNFIQEQQRNIPGVNGTRTVPPKKETMQETKNVDATTVDEASQSNDEEVSPEEQGIPVDAEGALVNPFLTPEQRELKNSRQYPIMQEHLKKLNQEELDNLQMVSVEVLENRLGAIELTHLLVVVASMDNKDLNKVMNHLME